MARNVSKLKVIDDPDPEATILKFDGPPIASGKGDMDLVCGRCGTLLVHGETASDVALQYKVLQLVVQCQCSSFNLLS